ncbi:MAG: hypothetical protein A3J38_03735 [Gammaproteobacteria bacterium RIFCSPHIGHO2_12_FULL_45_9]|nr:MAG: hypothetical protein A3J38_03735 [Gammaproteobacteria bacterium RIFCSPHIGHO2_12_FULL_45_9]
MRFCIGLLGIGFLSTAFPYYGRELCNYSDFKCVTVGRHATWNSLFPDARERTIVMRLNRTTLPLYTRSWIVVPKNISDINYLALSPLPGQTNGRGERTVIIDLSTQAFGAYDESGNQVYWGPVSTGKGYCPDIKSACRTPTGSYRVYAKAGPDCKSSIFPIETHGGAPMPYCMHFHKGFAMHGGVLPGYPASHGCVRLMTEDAQWLSQHFIKIGTRVVLQP